MTGVELSQINPADWFWLPRDRTLFVTTIGAVPDKAPPPVTVAHVEHVISPALLTAMGDVAVIAPPPDDVTQVAHAIWPAALIVVGDAAVKRPPLVVVAHVGQAIVPVVVIAPPVIGDVVAMLVTDPDPFPSGPCVTPLMRMNAPADVVHKSPLTGEVGVAPCGMLIPAFDVVDAAVVSFPDPVSAEYVAVPLMAGLISVIVVADRLAGNVVEMDGTPPLDVTRTPLLAVARPATAAPVAE